MVVVPAITTVLPSHLRSVRVDNAKIELRKELVRHGVSSLEELKARYPLGCAVDNNKLQAWILKQTAPPVIPPLRDKPRLINRFKLGADPEFVIAEASRDRRISAEQLKLHVGQAFGADLNGRLVEIRPKAYRNALKVLGSTLQTLRWLALQPYVHDARGRWLAGAYQFDDGLGGHVHLGRKRELRKVSKFLHDKNIHNAVPEIQALDKLALLLTGLGVFPEGEVKRRRDGDGHGQIYGALGDVRIQAHGYEYRTFPSWLDSPWLAYFVLVLSKLVILDPDLTKQWRVGKSENCLQNLLAHYKGRDDDAWLALYAWKQHGLPQHIGGDFKPRWGLNYPVSQHLAIVPTTMAASKEAINDLYNFLVHKQELKPTMPTINWEPAALPKDYVLLTDYNRTIGCKGLGDIIWDGCTHITSPVEVSVQNNPTISVSSALAAKLSSDWRTTLRNIQPSVRLVVFNSNEQHIVLGASYREPREVPITRKLLYSGVFPIWSAKTIQANSFAAWQKTTKQQHKTKAYEGREIVAYGNLTI